MEETSERPGERLRDWVPLTSAESPTEAHFLAALLEAKDIPAVVQGEFVPYVGPAFQSQRVCVPRELTLKARTVLASLRSRNRVQRQDFLADRVGNLLAQFRLRRALGACCSGLGLGVLVCGFACLASLERLGSSFRMAVSLFLMWGALLSILGTLILFRRFSLRLLLAGSLAVGALGSLPYLLSSQLIDTESRQAPSH